MNKIVKTRLPPTVVSIGNREMISTCALNVQLVADKIIKDGVNEWLPVSDVAKFAYGKALSCNVTRVRRAVWKLRTHLLDRGFLLITEGYPIANVKIYTGLGEDERQAAMELLKRMYKKISAEKYQKAERLFNGEEKKPAA